MASRVERVKMIDDKHVANFFKSSHGEEFREFRKAGIAAHVSNLKSVYTMYLNTLDKRPTQKKELQEILEEHRNV